MQGSAFVLDHDETPGLANAIPGRFRPKLEQVPDEVLRGYPLNEIKTKRLLEQ